MAPKVPEPPPPEPPQRMPAPQDQEARRTANLVALRRARQSSALQNRTGPTGAGGGNTLTGGGGTGGPSAG